MERATMTIPQAAVYLGISRTTAYSLARENQLPTIRLGRRILVSRVVLDRMLEGSAATGLTSPDMPQS